MAKVLKRSFSLSPAATVPCRSGLRSSATHNHHLANGLSGSICGGITLRWLPLFMTVFPATTSNSVAFEHVILFLLWVHSVYQMMSCQWIVRYNEAPPITFGSYVWVLIHSYFHLLPSPPIINWLHFPKWPPCSGCVQQIYFTHTVWWVRFNIQYWLAINKNELKELQFKAEGVFWLEWMHSYPDNNSCILLTLTRQPSRVNVNVNSQLLHRNPCWK